MEEETASARVVVRISFVVPDEQLQFLPSRSRAPKLLPLEAPLPRYGETVWLSSSSAWAVSGVVHEWNSELELRVAVWLTYSPGAARYPRDPDFETTQ